MIFQHRQHSSQQRPFLLAAAQLTSDIVWLIEREVTLADGTTQKVLAPQLYLAPRSGDLLPSGALISADSLKLNLTGDLVNSGSIAGRQLVSLAANNIKNLGGTIAADNVALSAQTDLTNQGGRIAAVSSLELQAGQDITVASSTRTQTTAQGSRTNIDRVAGLYVTGSSGTLTAIAGRDASFNGAEINNAGSGATTLAAANNLNLGAVTESNRQNIVFDGRNHLNTASTSDTGSQIRTQGELALIAGNDITAQAVNIQSAGNVGLTAGNDVTILAGQRTQTIDEATYHKSKGDGLFSTTRTTSSSFKSEQGDVVASQLSGPNVSIQAQRNASLEAAQVTAQNKLAINAGNDINIIAAEQTFTSAQSQMESKTNTFGLGRSSLKETLDINQVHQVGSVLQGKEVVLVSGNNLNLSASRIEGTDTVALTATNQINILAATDLDERKETREYKNNIFGIDTLLQPFKGTNGLQNSLGLVTPKSFVSPARAKDKIKGEESESSRTAVRSELLGGDITLQSGADTTLQAPVIKGNSLTVKAGVINGQAVTPDAKIILEGVKESTTTNQTGSSHSFVWQSMAGQGGTNETLILPKIELGKPGESGNQTSPTLNASGGIVVDAASLPGTAFEANKTGGTSETSKPLATTVIDLKSQAQELAKQPGMAWLGDLTKRDDVDWQTIKLVQDTWSYKNSGLTPEGGIVVAIIVAILLQDWSGTTATAITGATEGVVYAATQAAILATASASATSLINNKGNISKTLKDMSSDETLKQIVLSALTAGALQAVGGTSWMKQFSGTTITDRLVTQMVNSAVSSTIQTAITGGDYEENLSNALLIGGVNAVAGWAASGIGDWYSQSDLAGKYIAHKVAHALLGCAGAAAKGSDCASGAIGAAVGEAFAEMYGGDSDTPLTAQKQFELLQLSKLVAMATAKVAGKDPLAAMDTAQIAVANNFLTHVQANAMRKEMNQCQSKKDGCSDSDVISIFTKYRDLSTQNIATVENCIFQGNTQCVRNLETQAASGSEVDAILPFGYGVEARLLAARQNNVNIYGSVKGDGSLFGTDVQQAQEIAKFRQDNCLGVATTACDSLVKQALDYRMARVGILMAAGALTSAAANSLNSLRRPPGTITAGKTTTSSTTGANGGVGTTIITPEMETKILFGERVTNASGTPTNRLIGAHGGEISNSNPNYAVEVLSVNADGTRNAKLVTQFSDGNLSNIKSSTLFPENWTSNQTIGAVKQVGDMPPVATRADGATLYQSTVNGVKIEVIKVGNNVTAAYPCGRGCTSPTTFSGH